MCMHDCNNNVIIALIMLFRTIGEVHDYILRYRLFVVVNSVHALGALFVVFKQYILLTVVSIYSDCTSEISIDILIIIFLFVL